MASKQGISGRSLGRMESGFDLGAPPMILHFASTTSTGTSNTDAIFNNNAPFKFRVIRAWVGLTEAAQADSEDIKLTDGTNDITDTMDISAGADNDHYEFSSYDNAYFEIAKGGSLKIVKTASTAVISCNVYVEVVRV